MSIFSWLRIKFIFKLISILFNSNSIVPPSQTSPWSASNLKFNYLHLIEYNLDINDREPKDLLLEFINKA